MLQNENYPTKDMTELFQAILSLKTTTEAEQFFRDLFSMKELDEFSKRWQMVKQLIDKKSYATISKNLKTSTATVTRVAQWLKHGTGGLAHVAKRQFSSRT
jgi:TrpR-related protein YerC/YecD